MNTLNARLGDILKNNRVTDDDVLAVRREVYGDGVITPVEADFIFRINELGDKPQSWSELFVEAITSFLVHQTMPHGYINQANAAWLMARIDHDGIVETQTEIELLLRVLEKSRNATDSLEKYALEQVKQAVVYGRGALANGRELKPGHIGEAEVEMLRRVLYACASEGGIGISKLEAEALFDLSDMLGDEGHHESWQTLFVGAIANHLMMLAAWEEPDMAEALRREKWLESRGRGFVVPSFKGFGEAFKSMFSSETGLEFSNQNQSATTYAERVDEIEAVWLIDRLNRDGKLSANEKVLLRFLRDESPDIHAALIPYIKAA